MGSTQRIATIRKPPTRRRGKKNTPALTARRCCSSPASGLLPRSRTPRSVQRDYRCRHQPLGSQQLNLASCHCRVNAVRLYRAQRRRAQPLCRSGKTRAGGTLGHFGFCPGLGETAQAAKCPLLPLCPQRPVAL
jgi:hypothetical protein